MNVRLALAATLLAAPAFAAPPDPAALAATIDARLAVRWAKAGVRPAAAADDATFLRRATLDLAGRIPTVAETRAFLADDRPGRRARLVHQLVESGGHTRHMATTWRRAWVPQADTAEFARLADEFEAWVTVRLRDNTPYDRMVRELLTTPPGGAGRRADVSPVSFFAASEYKPENLAANATRAFLGINLDCAQCHDHPFARWTRDQFWQTAAFFAPPPAGKMARPELMIPNTKKSLPAEVMDGKPLAWPDAVTAETGRRLLAGWVTAPENPYFARNAVNRVWAQVFGTGLVEPLDDLSGENPASHPELLDELTKAFVASGHDLKFVTKAVALTKAYQLSTAAAEGPGGNDPRLFARMPVRGLTGEQLYDSLRTAAGLPPERADTGTGQGLDARKRFAARFRIDRPVTAERSIVQALSMMNGRVTSDLMTAATSPTLAAADAPFLDTRGKVETLFMAALGRAPTGAEASRMAEFVEDGNPSQALADVFWALLNSTEFNTNH